MFRKTVAVATAVALVAGSGWWFAAARAADGDGGGDGAASARFITAPVTRGMIHASVSASGPLAAANGVTVRSNQTGSVAALLAQDGDRVRAGQVVLRLSNDDLVAAQSKAENALENADRTLQNLLHPQETALEAQRVKVEKARTALQQRQSDVESLTVTAPSAGVVTMAAVSPGDTVSPGKVLFTLFDDATPVFTANLPQDAAAAVVPGQEASVVLPGFGTFPGKVPQWFRAGQKSGVTPVPVDLPAVPGVRPGMAGQVIINFPGRPFRVQATGAIAADGVSIAARVSGTVAEAAVREGDRVAAGQVLARLASDGAILALHQAENDLAAQERALADLTAPAGISFGQVPVLTARTQAAGINLAVAQSAVDDLEVKAPVDGLISGLTVRPGDRITVNQPIFRVADYGQMQVTIPVSELDIPQVRAGMTARVSVDALPDRVFTGVVTSVGPEGETGSDLSTYPVTVAIDHPAGLMGAMNATVTINVADKEGLYVPAQAVKVEGGVASVQVPEDGEPVDREVGTGLRSADQVEITHGLTEGDEVILTVIPERPQPKGFSFRLPGLGSKAPKPAKAQKKASKK